MTGEHSYGVRSIVIAHGTRSITFHSTAVRIGTFNTVSTLFTVWADRALTADFSFWMSSVVIAVNGPERRHKLQSQDGFLTPTDCPPESGTWHSTRLGMFEHTLMEKTNTKV